MSEPDYDEFVTWTYGEVHRMRRGWDEWTNVFLADNNRVQLPWILMTSPISVIMRIIRDYATCRNQSVTCITLIPISHVTRWYSSIRMCKAFFDEFHYRQSPAERYTILKGARELVINPSSYSDQDHGPACYRLPNRDIWVPLGSERSGEAKYDINRTKQRQTKTENSIYIHQKRIFQGNPMAGSI
ncbi:hypothetical protein SISNIDRAFT_469744 [Sistotremastrum niveocremeum HHB9708]|uniref:Uncharacterized protein n=1 Tax=Sistotremastrum niveocremeum HHB9708 TaxID=1314777 RepID=A0A164PLN4_9AGAM|nr:hypothetical protein SISNIDRAFT_469744 [Sistotremastrum niveocremeum HHB9708]